MSQALFQQLVKMILISEYDLVSLSSYGWQKFDIYHTKIKQNRKLKQLFQPTIEKMSENLGFWLKDFKGDWSLINPTRSAFLVKEQKNIDNLRKKLDEIKSDRLNFNRKNYPVVSEYRKKIDEEQGECLMYPQCEQDLNAHLENCQNGCTKYHVAYDCRYTDNGRCKHWYSIERYDQALEHYDFYDDQYEDDELEVEFCLKRALGVQRCGSEEAYDREVKNSDWYNDDY